MPLVHSQYLDNSPIKYIHQLEKHEFHYCFAEIKININKNIKCYNHLEEINKGHLSLQKGLHLELWIAVVLAASVAVPGSTHQPLLHSD